MSRLRIGSRGSRLALAQANLMRAAIERLHPGIVVEMETITTSGDRFLDQSLAKLGGKGLFVKEIEEALRSRSIDLAVHSMKDVPAVLAPGLVVAAVPVREHPGDVVIGRKRCELGDLPRGGCVGTSSVRRMALVRHLRSDLNVVPLRGNVDTRLRKVRSGEFDAIVLAVAGLHRLGLEVEEAVPLDPAIFPPAIGQGALAIETRADDTCELVAPLDHRESRLAVDAERAFMRGVGGSCTSPLAAHAVVDGETLKLHAAIVCPDGSRVVQGDTVGSWNDAEHLGLALAERLLGAGGAAILRAIEDSG